MSTVEEIQKAQNEEIMEVSESFGTLRGEG